MADLSHNSGTTGHTALSPAGRRLLRIAEDLARGGSPEEAASERPSPLSEFVRTYREWITTSRGKSGTQQQQAEQWQLVMHAMVTAPDIGEAIRRLIRFGKVVWGDRGPTELRREDDRAVLVFAEPYRAGPEGLIAAIWVLALTLCELEFLADARFAAASGRVLHDACLPEGIVPLLFAAPVAFDAGEVALLIPLRDLRRPVAARADDLPRFFAELLPLTLGARRQSPSIRAMAAGLIRDDKRGPAYRKPTLANVATRLGMSTATLRRRLRDEGTTYRLLREGIVNGLAQDWLRRGGITVEEVATRLDFSDGFAFRRFFRRLNGMPPSTFCAAHRRAPGEA